MPIKQVTERRTDFKSALTYTGQKLEGLTMVTKKEDGIRLLSRKAKIVTRNDKVPLGIGALTPCAIDYIHAVGDVEVSLGDFAATQSALSTITSHCIIGVDHCYQLDYIGTDHPLWLGNIADITPNIVEEYLKDVLAEGAEGLVLHAANGNWYRVKPYYTADVRVTGVFEQMDNSGNPKDTLGGFTTNYGNVTAFSEFQRGYYWDQLGMKGMTRYDGRLIEVVYRELYPSGNFRYAVTFKRFRDDKDEETFDHVARLTPNKQVDLAALLANN